MPPHDLKLALSSSLIQSRREKFLFPVGVCQVVSTVTSTQQALTRGSGVNDHRTNFGIAGVHTEPLPLGGVWSCLSLGIQASAASLGTPSLPQKAGGQDPCTDAPPGTCAGLSAAQAREGGLHPVPAACRVPPPTPTAARALGLALGTHLFMFPGSERSWAGGGQGSLRSHRWLGSCLRKGCH